MPIVSSSWTDAVRDSLTTVLDALRNALNTLDEATDFDRLTARIQPLFAQMAGIVQDLEAAVPAGDAFLVTEGVEPAPGQVTVDQFAGLLAAGLHTKWTPELSEAFGSVDPAAAIVAGPTLAAQVADFLRRISPILDPEIYLRFALNIKGKVTGEDAAAKAVDAVVDAAKAAVAAWQADWGDDEPMTDEEKEKEEQEEDAAKIPSRLRRWLDDFVGKLPGEFPDADGPRGTAVGRDVHRAVLAGYAKAHTDRLVIVDGVIRISSLPDEGLRLSRLLTPAGEPIGDDPQLIAFANKMRSTQTGKRIRPDIADMGPRAAGLDQDWGWFEVKPMGRIRAAVEETHFRYLPKWNDEIREVHEEWVKTAGVWQPTALFVTPEGYLFAAATVFPGAIGYLTYKLEENARLATALLLTTLSALFIQRLLTALRRLANRFEEAMDAFAEYLGGWALLMLMLVVMLFAAIALIPAEAAAGAGTALAMSISRIATQSGAFAK